MNICIDARLYGPAKNKGLGRYVEQLIKNLEKIDTENEYLVFLRRENWEDYTSGNSKFKKVLADYKWYSFAEQIFLPIKLWRLKCDLVHFPHFNVPLLYRGRFVVTIHDLIMYKFPDERATTRNKLLYKIKYWLHKIVVKSAVKRAERVIVVSEWTKKDVVQEFGIDEGKIVVTHLGCSFNVNKVNKIVNKVNNADVLEKYGIKKPYLLYVGNAYPHKNLERLIKAFNLVKKDYPDLQLVLVGKNDYFYDKLKKEILSYEKASFVASSAVTDSVVNHLDSSIPHHNDLWEGEVDYNRNIKDRKIIFTDYVTNGELAELYKNAQAYIFPSLYEGFGLPGLEAMSYGLPVVSSNASCLPEIYGEAALYFDPTDIGDMSKKIIQILDDEGLRQELINSGFEQVKKYNWRNCAERTLEVYAHLL